MTYLVLEAVTLSFNKTILEDSQRSQIRALFTAYGNCYVKTLVIFNFKILNSTCYQSVIITLIQLVEIDCVHTYLIHIGYTYVNNRLFFIIITLLMSKYIIYIFRQVYVIQPLLFYNNKVQLRIYLDQANYPMKYINSL